MYMCVQPRHCRPGVPIKTSGESVRDHSTSSPPSNIIYLFFNLASFNVRFSFENGLENLPDLGRFSGPINAINEGYQDLAEIEPECLADPACLAETTYDRVTDLAEIGVNAFTDEFFPTQETRLG